jgi:hypothetical protein
MVVSFAKPLDLFFDSCPVAFQRQAMDFETCILEEFFEPPSPESPRPADVTSNSGALTNQAPLEPRRIHEGQEDSKVGAPDSITIISRKLNMKNMI